MIFNIVCIYGTFILFVLDNHLHYNTEWNGLINVVSQSIEILIIISSLEVQVLLLLLALSCFFTTEPGVSSSWSVGGVNTCSEQSVSMGEILEGGNIGLRTVVKLLSIDNVG